MNMPEYVRLDAHSALYSCWIEDIQTTNTSSRLVLELQCVAAYAAGIGRASGDDQNCGTIGVQFLLLNNLLMVSRQQLEPENSRLQPPCQARSASEEPLGRWCPEARALQTIVQRHSSLRTRFMSADGHVMASIRAAAPLDLAYLNLDHLREEEKEEHALVLAVEEGRRRFDLSAGPLLRVRLLRLSPAEHLLILAIHHIISDGWSIGVLVKEMARAL